MTPAWSAGQENGAPVDVAARLAPMTSPLSRMTVSWMPVVSDRSTGTFCSA